jgi:small-conductance mechanosensitive channel
MNPEMNSLLGAVLADFDHPDFWWQIAVLVLCLGMAKLAERFVRGQKLTSAHAADMHWRLGQGGVRRIAFPLIAVLLVVVSRALLRSWHPVNLLSIAIPLLLSLAAIRAVFYVLRYSFNPSGWLASFERTFAALLWILVALHIVGLLPDLIDMLESIGFTVGKQHLNLWMIAQGVATLIFALLLALWLAGLLEARLAATESLDGNLRVVFSRLSKAILMLMAVMIGLPLVGIDLTTLSVFGGALGVGLGFGLQKIASNYVSGFIILLDRSIRIGNVIAIGGERGQVTRITTRYTVLKSVNGVEAIVPNELLVGSIVLNESYTDQRVRFALRVQVSYACDLEQAMRLMEEAPRTQSRVLNDPLPKAYVIEFADNGITLELGFWITDPEEGTQELRSDINLAVWKSFKAAGIEIPCPQREVRLIGGGVGPEAQLPLA